MIVTKKEKKKSRTLRKNLNQYKKNGVIKMGFDNENQLVKRKSAKGSSWIISINRKVLETALELSKKKMEKDEKHINVFFSCPVKQEDALNNGTEKRATYSLIVDDE